MAQSTSSDVTTAMVDAAMAVLDDYGNGLELVEYAWSDPCILDEDLTRTVVGKAIAAALDAAHGSQRR